MKQTRLSSVVSGLLAALGLAGAVSTARAQTATTDSSIMARTVFSGKPANWCGTRLRPRAKSAIGPRAGCPGEGTCDSSPALRNSNIATATTPWLSIRLYFNVFAYADGTGLCATDAKIAGQMDYLNKRYAAMRIRFINSGSRVIRSDRFRDLGGDTKGGDDTELIAMKNFSAFEPQSRLNVFLLNTFQYQDNLLGVATFPWDKDAAGNLVALTKQGGLLCDDDAFGAGGSTVPHELGHCVGMLHTHAGTSDLVEDGQSLAARCGEACAEVAGRTPAMGDVTGDFASDTPADPVNYDCFSTPGNDPCNGRPWGVTDFKNIMGYAPDNCQDHFTAQQGGRSRCWVKANLLSLVAPTAQFAANSYSVSEVTPSVTLTVSRIGPLTAPLSVTYSTTTGGTATAGADYTAVSGTLSWAAGDAANKTIVVRILNDTIVEANETIRVALGTPAGGVAGLPQSVFLSIIDDDICAAPTNLLQDPTFEAGNPWPGWTTQTSTVNGTPLCDENCGPDGVAAGPQSGTNWAWFGGAEGKAENATLGQRVIFPAGKSINLRFALKIGQVTAPFTDVLRVKVDNVIVFTQLEPSLAQTAFKTYNVNLSQYANGAAHTVLFEYVGPAGGGNANFNVDNAYLYSCPIPATTTALRLAPATITATPAGASTIGLSSAVVRSGADSVQLAFTGALAPNIAADSGRYSIVVNGHEVPVESATYLSGNRVFLTVPVESIKAGDKVVVAWNDLRDLSNRTLSGKSPVLIAQ